MSADFTSAANSVYAATQDAAAKVPEGFLAGALDFCSSLFGWVIFRACKSLDYIGMGLLAGFTVVMMFINRKRIAYAEQLLRNNPKLPKSEVATLSGYDSLSAFYRNFSSFKSTPPDAVDSPE